MHELAVADLMALLPIAGPPSKERAVATFIQSKLVEMGVPPDAIRFDNAQEQSEYGGEIGNMIVQLPGEAAGPRLMFSTIDPAVIRYKCTLRNCSDTPPGTHGNASPGCASNETIFRPIGPLFITKFLHAETF